MKRRTRAGSSRGHAIIEATLMMPWIVFLFVGVLDFGFYSYAAIATENAARVAAVANSFATGNATDSIGACNLVLQEMNALPNMRTVTTCTGNPITVTVPAIVPVIQGLPAAEVTVTYQSIPMIPIPGVLMGQITITRTVDVPILNSAPAG